MRLAHFSDLHYGTATLEEADRCFGTAIDRVVAAGVEAAVLSGDATDHGLDLHEPATIRLLGQVRRLADHCPVLILQGTFSHEPPGTLAVFRLLGARYPVHVAERIEQVALLADGRWLASTGWRFDALPAGARALVSCVPTINKAVVAAAVGAAEAAQAVGEHLALLLAGFAPINRRARGQGIPTLALSHGTVFGSLNEHGVPMAGADHEFTTGVLFATEAQAVMLGHIHRHQCWQQQGPVGRQCIAYAGSIGRFHYGEEGDKGFLLWEVAADAAYCELVPTPARRTVDIVFEGRPDLAVLQAAVDRHGVDGAHVRVRWTVADEDRHAVDRAAIMRLLAGAAQSRLEGRIVPVVRARAPGISQLDSLTAKVQRWAELTGVEPACVLACLETLGQDGPAEIAARLLGEQAAAPRALPDQAPAGPLPLAGQEESLRQAA
ncbi:metallophosphatase family protein [Dechloromonas agitata]|uniref:metallophosphoesterase family protein n=1 Tax=Dechloromonas agitata TaxID=73030 RepID=UPI00237D588F|nr:metallophosphatase family protein [Dechloromonas agitata]MDE1544099.1 metallophosphatase family protein [Dechloromonas agitata]